MTPTVKSFFQFPVIKIIAGITICLGTLAVVKNYLVQPLLYYLFADKMVADIIKNCISFVVLLTSYYFFEKIYEQRKPVELSTKKVPKEMFFGFGLGFFTISLSVLILYLFGYYRIVTISTASYSLKLFTLLLTAALAEDLLIRGLIFRIFENWLGTYTALIIAMLFETMHVFNPNSNLFSTFMDLGWGFTTAMLYVYSKRIWLPFFFHVGWNFAQPFYGSNLTGVEDMGTIIHAKFQGPELFTGGRVGIEGSVFTVILLLIIGFGLFYLAKRDGKIIYRKIK